MPISERKESNLSIKYLWANGITTKIHYPDISRGLIRERMRPVNCEISRLPESTDEARWVNRCIENVSPPESPTKIKAGIATVPAKSYKEAFEQSERKAIKIMELRANFYNDDGGMLQATYHPGSDIRWDKQVMNFLPITVGFNREAITDEEKEWCKKCKSMCKKNEKVGANLSTHDETLPEKLKAKSDKLGLGIILIPMYSIYRIGKIFIEGLRYGRDNWKKGVFDKEYQEERLEHAFNHLILYKEGDTSEDHLAKVAWFCITQMELMRLEKEGLKNDSEQL